MSSDEPQPAAARSLLLRAGLAVMSDTYREQALRPVLTVVAVGVTGWQLWTRTLVLPPLAITLFLLVAVMALASLLLPRPGAPERVEIGVIAAYGVLGSALFPLVQSTTAASLFAFVASGMAGGVLASRRIAFTIAGINSVIATLGTLLVAELVPTAAEWPWWLALTVGLPVLIGTSRRDRIDALRNAHRATEQAQRAAASEAREAALVERGRIAREIHDVLGHSLSGIAVQLDMADALAVNGRQDEAMAAIRKARSLAVDSISETRRAVHALREDTLPVQEALLLMAANDGVGFQLVGEPGPVSVETAHTVVRAAQEALTNAVKYAPGAVRAMTLTFTDDVLKLVVTNGPARSARSDIAGGTGMGLVGMRERVALLGGTLRAEPEPDGGWTVELEVPR
ncbi:MAG TPA: histidine kinase [Pseudonocardiaceae bacterium]|nr:histidine kinase [Pseudonocardiaceae bacterium]